MNTTIRLNTIDYKSIVKLFLSAGFPIDIAEHRADQICNAAKKICNKHPKYKFILI